MSEYKPTVSVIRNIYVHSGEELGDNDLEERGEAFDRFLAEAERAAAEKAWDACLDEVSAQGTVQLPVNPHREGNR